MLAVEQGNSSIGDKFSKIKVGYVENRTGQVVRNDLVDTLNPRGEPDHPEYTLTMRIEEPQQNLSFQRDDSVTNVGYGIVAYWQLRNKSGTVIFSSSSSSSSEYVVSTSQYATAISAQNTRDQIALDITQDIRDKLARYFLSQTPRPSH